MAIPEDAVDRDSCAAGDVVARLREAHDRIREVLADAAAIAESGGRDGGSGRRAGAAREVLQYLMIDMPLHEADEDASIAPRLGASAHSLDGVIERVEEHGRIDALVAELSDDWRRMRDEGAMPPDPLRHRARVSRLRRLLEAHLAAEEREIFPRVAALPELDRLEIVREMEERRAHSEPA